MIRMAGIRMMAALATQGWLLAPPALPAEPASACDLGVVTQYTGVRHTWTITNATADTAQIYAVRPSCECLQVLSHPRAVPPGRAAQIVLRLVPDKPGAVAYECTAEMAGARPPAATLVLRAQVAPAAEAVPPAPIKPDLLTRRLLDPDESLYVSLPALEEKLARGASVLFVDVRGQAAFERCHMPGAVNLPAFSLKTRTFLKARDVVLVDEGYDDESLEAVCRELRGAGLAATAVLRGGLLAWAAAGRPLAGDARAARALTLLSPQDFFRIHHVRDWPVVSLTDDPSRSAALVPDAQVIGAGAPAGPVAGRAAAGAPARIIVLADGDAPLEALAAAVGQTSDLCVFSVRGGLAAYEQYLLELDALRYPRLVASQSAAGPGLPARSGKSCGGCP